MNLAGYVDAFGNLTAIGAIVLLFWRMTSHTLPRIAGNFEKAIDKSWSRCEEILKDQRKDFKEMLSQQRSDFRDSLQQHKLVCQNDIDRLIKSVNENGK